MIGAEGIRHGHGRVPIGLTCLGSFSSLRGANIAAYCDENLSYCVWTKQPCHQQQH